MHITCIKKIVFKDFEIKSFGEYHGFCLKSDASRLANVFKNFKKIV